MYLYYFSLDQLIEIKPTEFYFQNHSILCTFLWLYIHITKFSPPVPVYIPTTSRCVCHSQICSVFKIFIKSLPTENTLHHFKNLFSLITNGNERFSYVPTLTFYLNCVFRYFLTFLSICTSSLLIPKIPSIVRMCHIVCNFSPSLASTSNFVFRGFLFSFL